MLLFITLYKVLLTFMSVDGALVCDQTKTIEEYSRVVLFIVLVQMKTIEQYLHVATFTFANSKPKSCFSS